MEFTRITSIKDPLFAQMHKLMQEIFPREEVLDFPCGKNRWKIRVFGCSWLSMKDKSLARQSTVITRIGT